MAVTNAMFIFEVVVESVQSLVESRCLVIRSEFADIFSLELKDPKQMHIVMPEPSPLPPEPPGKKSKKKKKKPKPKKGKRKGKIEAPPPEPAIQSGQSVLFTSNAQFLIQNMKKCPLEISLWSKEDNFVFIGSYSIPWDPIFLIYLEKITNGESPEPVTLKENYNIFEEGTAKMMAKLGMQIKLSYLGEKVTTAFRTLSEDQSIKKCLYTGINSKDTSYMCTMKTTDKDFEQNCNKIENSFIVDKPKPTNVVYADYKNAPGANLTSYSDEEYCCMGHADKPPDSIYKAPETCPDIDFIIDYVRKIIVSCNDNMRMLTPRPTIIPRVKATDIDRLCYCKESAWPQGTLAEKFKKEAQSGPCPICIDAEDRVEISHAATFDIANIRGPCGRPDCRIARDIRAYIENLVEEDNKEFDINELIGPCGSKSCTLAEKIQEFLRHEGIFSDGYTVKGLSTQCECNQLMQKALTEKTSCDSVCSKECDESDTDVSPCDGKGCPFSKQTVYNVFYFTVEHDFEKESSGTSSPQSVKSSMYKYCSSSCPSVRMSEKIPCSKLVCSNLSDAKAEDSDKSNSKCQSPVCTSKNGARSPADSHVAITFKDIHNPCCVKSCDVAEKVKDFIVDAVTSKKIIATREDDPCYCDCECNFQFTKNTTYCAVCSGYECLGDDVKDQPEYIKPHPCPVYHKLYNKKYIMTPSPWPDEEVKQKTQSADGASVKSSKTTRSASKTLQVGDRRLNASRAGKISDKKSDMKEEFKAKNVLPEQKKVGKFTANVEEKSEIPVEKKPEFKYPYPPVPKNMGWNWTAEDIPGLKPRPNWKPGAANKILVRRYRAMREGTDIIAKKKRAMMQKKKKIEMKPTLIVNKRDGEYTVQMEVFKKYSSERLPFQYPYEEKPPLTYTIGKTDAEKREIQKQRERRYRRETRRKSRMLQSTFRDKCQEICLKAYNQAIGLLPLPNPNDPECPCSTATGQAVSPVIDSCSCSEEATISSSDTDNDEWTIEFSPPAARFDPKAKHPPAVASNETQYTYLDYKVKLLDRSGNPVPRFFKGPDDKQECSDLGGFWSPDHVWMEINKDGYIGTDNRWVPMNFVGPDGMFYSSEEGSFTDNTGRFLKIGVDGYINKEGKWAWYLKPKTGGHNVKSAVTVTTVTNKATKNGKPESAAKGKTDAKEPLATAKGKGEKEKDRKTVKIDKDKNIIPGRRKNVVMMNASINYEKAKAARLPADRMKLDSKNLQKYKEIMAGLEMYESFYDFKPLMKTNRATQNNTFPKKPSTYPIKRPMETVGSTLAKSYKTNSPSCSGSPMIR